MSPSSFLGQRPLWIWPTTREASTINRLPDLCRSAKLNSRTPKTGDWLHWRRTSGGSGHSPLTEITTENVGNLALSWSIALAPGSSQITPLVRDGIMFLTHPDNMIQALNAATGTLIWEYRYPYPKDLNCSAGRHAILPCMRTPCFSRPMTPRWWLLTW